MTFISLDGQNSSQKLSMGRYTLNCDVVRNRNTTPEAQAPATTAPTRAYALVIGVGPDEYLVAGKNIQMTFSPSPPVPEVAEEEVAVPVVLDEVGVPDEPPAPAPV